MSVGPLHISEAIDADHIADVGKMVDLGSGSRREIVDRSVVNALVAIRRSPGRKRPGYNNAAG